MPEVTVRDAHRGDARGIADIWAAAVPVLVRSAARAAADLREDRALGRRRWVGLVDGEVAGTAAARLLHGETLHAAREVVLEVEVHPRFGSRGVGTALLETAVAAWPGVAQLHATCTDEPISMAFAVRFGFLPLAERLVSTVRTAEVADPGPAPVGLRATTLDRLPSLEMLLDTYNHGTRGDPDGLTVPLTLKELRQGWWNGPDNASDLSWGLVADSPSAPLLTAFSSTTLDRERGQACGAMTTTDPSYRRRGLATWVKRRSLRSLHEAGVAEASTTVDAGNAAMATLNQALGYRPRGVLVHVGRRLAR